MGNRPGHDGDERGDAIDGRRTPSNLSPRIGRHGYSSRPGSPRSPHEIKASGERKDNERSHTPMPPSSRGSEDKTPATSPQARVLARTKSADERGKGIDRERKSEVGSVNKGSLSSPRRAAELKRTDSAEKKDSATHKRSTTPSLGVHHHEGSPRDHDVKKERRRSRRLSGRGERIPVRQLSPRFTATLNDFKLMKVLDSYLVIISLYL